MELSVMEQPYQAIMAVMQDGWKVTEVADRLKAARQSVHNWLARYEAGGLPPFAGRSHKPQNCSHQISPELEALICEMRRKHPGWGPGGSSTSSPSWGSPRCLVLEHPPLSQAPQPHRAAAKAQKE